MKTKHAKLFDNEGFSLVELIIVVAIMAILAAVAIPTFAHFITKANEAADIDFMNELERAITLANADKEAGEITEIQIHVNTADGSIIEVKYIEAILRDESQVIHERVHSSKDQEEKILSELLDFSYKFKATDSVTSNQNWSAQWEIVSDTPPDPWDQWDPSDY